VSCDSAARNGRFGRDIVTFDAERGSVCHQRYAPRLMLLRYATRVEAAFYQGLLPLEQDSRQRVAAARIRPTPTLGVRVPEARPSCARSSASRLARPLKSEEHLYHQCQAPWRRHRRRARPARLLGADDVEVLAKLRLKPTRGL
jgi:hypothetical protein